VEILLWAKSCGSFSIKEKLSKSAPSANVPVSLSTGAPEVVELKESIRITPVTPPIAQFLSGLVELNVTRPTLLGVLPIKSGLNILGEG